MKESFRDFMWRALYHPERGYYSRRIATVGARGDFSTSASLNPALPRAIAQWIIHEARTTGVTDVIEVGGGDGSLMEATRSHLGFWHRFKLRFHFVEVSASLQTLQKARLANCNIRWHTTLPEALALTNGRALIYHNELMDAFPVELVQYDSVSRTWNTISIIWSGESAHESLEAPLPDITPFSVLNTHPRASQRAEIGTDLYAWFKEWLPLWREGSMLGIDYGEEIQQLYHRRPKGTLRGYILQQRVEGPSIYLNVGRQDLTADVNFTDILEWLKVGTRREVIYETQSSFIERMGSKKVTPQSSADQAFKCVTVRL